MRSPLPVLLILASASPLVAQESALADTAPAPQDSLVLADMGRCHAPAGTPADTLLVIARAIRSERWSDSALVCIDAYLATHGDSGIGYLERARTLFDLHRSEEARRDWYAGAARTWSRESRALYRGDISWITPDSAMRRFDALPDDSVRHWLASFWAERELADARSPGERITEHYRRWWHVMRHYKGRNARRVRDIGALRRAYRDSVDDRGVVYMRYGEPSETATWNGAIGAADIRAPSNDRNLGLYTLTPDDSISPFNPQAVIRQNTEDQLSAIEQMDKLSAARPHPNISWRYDLPEGPLVLHFVAYRSGHYQLVESVTDAFGFSTGIRLSAGSLEISDRRGAGRNDPLLGIRSLFDSRSAIDPLYGNLAMSESFGGRRQLTEERSRGRAAMTLAVSTDRFAHRFDRELRPIVQTFAVGPSGDARGRVLVVFAVPGEPLVSGGRIDGKPFYPIRVRVVVSRDGRLAGEVDTLRRFVARGSLSEGRYLTGLAEVPVPPGEYRVQVVLEQALGGAGAAVRIDSVRVPETAPTALAMSDVIVGREGSGLAWRHRGRALPLNPLNAFTASASAELFYEVTGLATGEEYRTEIELRRVKGGKRAVALSFAERADGAYTPVTRSVDLSNVKPGHYSLIVRVFNAGGASVSRPATLYVIEARSYRDADDVIARTMPARPGGSTRGAPPAQALDPIVSEDELSVSVAADSSGGRSSVLWRVRGAGDEPRRLVFALHGDRHLDLGTGGRQDTPAGPVDEYRMSPDAWAALLAASRVELYLDDARFELREKRELRALRESSERR